MSNSIIFSLPILAFYTQCRDDDIIASKREIKVDKMVYSCTALEKYSTWIPEDNVCLR